MTTAADHRVLSAASSEATGRTLAVRLFNATRDPGTKHMLSHLMARDAMHRQQGFAIVEKLGGTSALPIPNSSDQSQEAQEFSYTLWDRALRGAGRARTLCAGPSLDGHGTYTFRAFEPFDEEPMLGEARPDSAARGRTDGKINKIRDEIIVRTHVTDHTERSMGSATSVRRCARRGTTDGAPGS